MASSGVVGSSWRSSSQRRSAPADTAMTTSFTVVPNRDLITFTSSNGTEAKAQRRWGVIWRLNDVRGAGRPGRESIWSRWRGSTASTSRRMGRSPMTGTRESDSRAVVPHGPLCWRARAMPARARLRCIRIARRGLTTADDRLRPSSSNGVGGVSPWRGVEGTSMSLPFGEVSSMTVISSVPLTPSIAA